MNGIQPNRKMDLESKINEAETYRTMGLLDESLGVYQQILKGIQELDPTRQESIRQNILGLKKQIGQAKVEGQNLSPKDISTFKESVSNVDSVPVTLDSASAFRELGLYNEAVSEYEKLFGLDYPPEKIIHEMAGCLFKIHSPSAAVKEVERMAKERGFGSKEKARIKFRLGMEITRTRLLISTDPPLKWIRRPVRSRTDWTP